MSRFIQIHALTIYPLSNPNRDETGRPKTAQYGGSSRLRLSSQALKRAIRLSEPFQSRLQGNLGERTQRIGDLAIETLAPSSLEEEAKVEIARQITNVFGKVDEKKITDKKLVHTRQLAFISPDEKAKVVELTKAAAAGEKLPDIKELKKEILRSADGAADVAMFGRMLADDPEFNREGAVQLSHAFTTHRALVEDDFYTAVDDNKKPAEDSGAGFVGEAGFGSGVFYLYGCIDRSLLLENLAGDESLANIAIQGFIEGLAVATPSGKRTSFAHQTRASYLQILRGDQQPLSLAGAFLNAVDGDELLSTSIKQLESHKATMVAAYGATEDHSMTMSLGSPDVVSLEQLSAFAAAVD